MKVPPMGDISTEPSMEEILSSIKRIIAEEGDAAPGPRARRAARPAASAPADPIPGGDEVLELSDPVIEPAKPLPIGAPDVPHDPRGAAEPPVEPMLSDRVAEATRGRLEALTKVVTRPEPPAASGGQTIEGMVQEMLKPMLSAWLDAHLPQIVERLVAREIERITGRN